jgi:hypothetical protein
MPEWEPSTQKCTRAPFQSSLVYYSSIFFKTSSKYLKEFAYFICSALPVNFNTVMSWKRHAIREL